MEDNSIATTSEAWKMRSLISGTSDTWFYTDDITVTGAQLRAYPDDAEVIPPCRISPCQCSHEQHIEELRAALARTLYVHHMMLEITHYRENITDTRCIREMHEAPLQMLSILARYPHKKDEA